MRMLYVEDDVLTRHAIAGRLRRGGHEVVEVASGEEAVIRATEDPNFDVALLDANLPGIDGVETYRRLQQLRPGLPAVVCSASLPVKTRDDFSSLGLAEHRLLSKPCPFSQLLSVLQSVTEDLGAP